VSATIHTNTAAASILFVPADLSGVCFDHGALRPRSRKISLKTKCPVLFPAQQSPLLKNTIICI
jgi:hypothetical protein